MLGGLNLSAFAGRAYGYPWGGVKQGDTAPPLGDDSGMVLAKASEGGRRAGGGVASGVPGSPLPEQVVSGGTFQGSTVRREKAG